ncbi:MAG: hypothetical protein ACKO40_09900 [Planctomycetaceae bacterium]
MPRHAIHLGTAWEPPAADVPAWVRRFGRPAGIEPGDRVLLVCEATDSVDPWREATLNDLALVWREAKPGSFESDVTKLLRPRNTLVVPGAAADGDPTERRAALPEAWGRLSLVIVSD